MYSPKRRIYFFTPVRCDRDILQVCHIFHSCLLYVMAACACGFTGRRLWLVVPWTQRKLIHMQLQQLPLVQTRRGPGFASSLASLSHALLREALGERCLFSGGWPQSLRSVRRKQLFGSWVVLWLTSAWLRAGGGAHALRLPRVARASGVAERCCECRGKRRAQGSGTRSAWEPGPGGRAPMTWRCRSQGLLASPPLCRTHGDTARVPECTTLTF